MPDTQCRIYVSGPTSSESGWVLPNGKVSSWKSSAAVFRTTREALAKIKELGYRHSPEPNPGETVAHVV